jgi:hypothetical protein
MWWVPDDSGLGLIQEDYRDLTAEERKNPCRKIEVEVQYELR